MPLVANSDLPAFIRLLGEGETVLSSEDALHQDIRELHIGLLNMMPDSALAATERQFFRLVGESNQIAQFYMHPFSLPQLPRGEKGQAHVDKFYESFESIKQMVHQGIGAAFVSRFALSKPERGLVCEDGTLSRQLGLIWRTDRTMSTASQTFLNMCLEHQS